MEEGTGNYALFMKPNGEEFRTFAQVSLDLTGRLHNVSEFWVAMRKNGLDEDRKRTKLNVAVSIDGGKTFPYTLGYGPHEGFVNADMDYQKFSFVFPPAVENERDVLLRFVGKAGGGPHLQGVMLIDDVNVFQAEADTFPPYIMGGELALKSPSTIKILFSEPLQRDSALLLSHYAFGWPVEETEHRPDDGHSDEGEHVEALEAAVPVVGEGPLPEIGSVALDESGYTVTLTLSRPLSIGETYALNIFNMTDGVGNVADTLIIDQVVFNIPDPGALVISEVFFADPSPAYATSKLQYVELYNPTNDTVPLGGLRIKGAISANGLPNVKLKPGEYWVATRNAEAYLATFGKSAWEWKGSWIEYEAEEEGELEPQSLYIQTTDPHNGIVIDSIGFDLRDSVWLALKQSGRSIQVCNALSDNLDPANWSVAGGDGFTYSRDGYDYTIHGTPGAACDDVQKPIVDLGPGGNRCGVTELTLDAGNPGSKYLWSTGETSQTILVATSGTFSVSVNNGVGIAYDTITVAFVPAIVAAGAIPPNACATSAVAFDDMSVDGVSTMWEFGDGVSSEAASATHRYEAPGKYQVKLVAANAHGCTDTLKTQVEVYVNEAAWTIPALLCENNEAEFSDNSAGATEWSWKFGDESSSAVQHARHTYARAGAYTVQLTVRNEHGCSRDVTQEVTVNPNRAGITSPASICAHTEANFSDASISGANWAWNFGDGQSSSGQEGRHTYGAPGQYDVLLTVKNVYGCLDTATNTVTVKPNELKWELPEGPVCTYTPLDFSGEADAEAAWTWEFGDGVTAASKNHQHTYTHDGRYQVRLTARNEHGCTNSITSSIEVGICVGVGDQMKEELITLYPNPSTGVFFIALDWTGTGPAIIKVLRPTGELAMLEALVNGKGRVQQFNVSQLPDGVYMIRVEADKRLLTRRLVIRH